MCFICLICAFDMCFVSTWYVLPPLKQIFHIITLTDFYFNYTHLYVTSKKNLTFFVNTTNMAVEGTQSNEC